MKLRLAIVATCLLAGPVAGCTHILDSVGRATPPASSSLTITRPDRPAATPAAEATICPLTPTGQTPYPAPEERKATGYPDPTDLARAMEEGSGYPSPGELPPATVVIPTLPPTPAEPTVAAPTATRVQPTATPAASATPQTPAPTPSDPIERAMLAAVRIESPAGDGAEVSAWRIEGLGVVLSTGEVVAPLHVLYDATSGQLYDREGRARVQAYDAAGYPSEVGIAALRAWDAGLDLAVLAITDGGERLTGAPLGAADAAALPAQAPLRLVLLAPEGERATRVMQTEVAGRYEDDGGPWIVATASLSTGAIGGGVAFNAAGQVVGLLQPEGGLAPGQLVRIRPIDAVQPLLAKGDIVQPLPATLPVAGEERLLRILYRGAEGVNLRSSPSRRASILDSLHRDEVYPIVSPGESDGWYSIYTGRGRAGWVALRHPTGTRLAEPETRAFRSALIAGGEAEVACLSATPGRGCANLRATPGWRNKAQDDILAELLPGLRLQLLSGPQQADGLAWWQVRDPKSGAEGWMAEVTANGYRALVASTP